MAQKKTRLDVLLAERGFYATAAQAARAVIAGDVRVAGEVVHSAGMQVKPDVALEAASGIPFVSRGGFKLQRALDVFGLDVTGLRCIDCGASTGGFTDCLLQAGAASVCAVDVGYGQFAWKLRQDERVSLFERTNIRLLAPQDAGAPFDVAVADISFAPLRSYLGAVISFLGATGVFVDLVKPQFEAAKAQVPSDGVIRDASVHVAVLGHAVELFREAGFGVCGLTYSPITGDKGNIEYLVMGRLGTAAGCVDGIDVEGTVAEAQEQLRR